MTEIRNFVHHRLEVYHLALAMLTLVHAMTKKMPRGYSRFAHQVLDAAGSTVANIGEGANRVTRGQKRQRFSEAKGEAGEVAAHTEVLMAMGLVSPHEANEILHHADRTCAMLTRLIQRHS